MSLLFHKMIQKVKHKNNCFKNLPKRKNNKRNKKLLNFYNLKNKKRTSFNKENKQILHYYDKKDDNKK